MQYPTIYNSPAEEAFMALVRSGIRNTAPAESLVESLGADEWEEIYSMARRQTVCGICYAAFCRLPDRLLPSHTLLTRWVARVDAIETANRAMALAAASLIAVLRRAGLHPVVQKGLSVARHYPNPELRECGDIDLWLPGREFDEAITVVSRSAGLKHNPDGSVSFSYRGFVVELHRRLINVSSPVVSYNLDSFTRRVCSSEVSHNDRLPSPPPLFELLLVSVHIMRHAFGTGVGLRQICDYYCAVKALRGSYDSDKFERACHLTGISKWIEILNGFLVRYLDIPAEELPSSGFKGKNNVSPDVLMRIIREGGNFGLHQQESGICDKPRAKGKMHTLVMFFRRSRFAASVAPSEAFWCFVRLLLGQLR